ncbi:NAD-dependent epimerase/dehydratase family protein [Mycobacteroides abscessus]|uniref:NAD-dependent epimerase/dehydratase family protein n=1 Tax=Mycobacteroides abscessus TaxID=36809 RepID=UPI000C264B02|nr:NAD-dependent epimerase/dehydratase family protein [Mycobacteroides abscessus]
MHILVTGVTGTIGGAVARALIRRGHEVTGTIRDEASRGAVPAGVELIVADLFEASGLADVARHVDGAVHAASSNDMRAPELDHGVVNTLLAAFEGTEKPFVYTSGLWIHGNGGPTPLTEESPFTPPMVVAWRPAVEQMLVEAAGSGLRTIRIRPGLVYGDGRGYVPMLFAPQEHGEGKAVRYFGDGSNRWAVVHADDLGDLYALAIEAAPAGSVYLGASEESVCVREAAMVVADRYGAHALAWDPADAVQYWNVMVEALMLDQVASHAHARAALGWQPHRPGLIEDLVASTALQRT